MNEWLCNIVKIEILKAMLPHYLTNLYYSSWFYYVLGFGLIIYVELIAT